VRDTRQVSPWLVKSWALPKGGSGAVEFRTRRGGGGKCFEQKGGVVILQGWKRKNSHSVPRRHTDAQRKRNVCRRGAALNRGKTSDSCPVSTTDKKENTRSGRREKGSGREKGKTFKKTDTRRNAYLELIKKGEKENRKDLLYRKKRGRKKRKGEPPACQQNDGSKEAGNEDSRNQRQAGRNGSIASS